MNGAEVLGFVLLGVGVVVTGNFWLLVMMLALLVLWLLSVVFALFRRGRVTDDRL